MLINPPNRIEPPSKPSELTESNQLSKAKRAPRMRMKTLPTFKSEDTVGSSGGTSTAPTAMMEQMNCLSNNEGQIIPIQEQQPLSQPPHTELSTSNLTNSSVINVNSFTTPTSSSIQQVLHSSGSHQPVQAVNSTGVPMDYTVATDYSMLMQSIAAAAHVGSSTPTTGVHPSFLQQQHHFTNMH